MHAEWPDRAQDSRVIVDGCGIGEVLVSNRQKSVEATANRTIIGKYTFTLRDADKVPSLLYLINHTKKDLASFKKAFFTQNHIYYNQTHPHHRTSSNTNPWLPPIMPIMPAFAPSSRVGGDGAAEC